MVNKTENRTADWSVDKKVVKTVEKKAGLLERMSAGQMVDK